MSAENYEEYTLGQEITDLALSKKARDTVVVSVRLPVGEFARLEKISAESGKSLSQVVRDAVSAYHEPEPQPGATFRFNMWGCEGIIMAVGPVEYTSYSCNPSFAVIPDGAKLGVDRTDSCHAPNSAGLPADTRPIN